MPTDDSLNAPTPSEEMLSLAGVCERTGFTLPYVEAMVEGGEFGETTPSASAGPFVRAAAVEDWMTAHGAHWPLTDEDKALLAESTPAEFFDELELTPEEKAARWKEIEEDRALSLAARKWMLAARRRRS